MWFYLKLHTCSGQLSLERKSVEFKGVKVSSVWDPGKGSCSVTNPYESHRYVHLHFWLWFLHCKWGNWILLSSIHTILLFYIIYMENSEFLRKLPSSLPYWTQQRNATAHTWINRDRRQEGAVGKVGVTRLQEWRKCGWSWWGGRGCLRARDGRKMEWGRLVIWKVGVGGGKVVALGCRETGSLQVRLEPHWACPWLHL